MDTRTDGHTHTALTPGFSALNLLLLPRLLPGTRHPPPDTHTSSAGQRNSDPCACVVNRTDPFSELSDYKAFP